MKFMNILLIEDDAGLVELITVMLEELGFSIRSATSGTEALAYLSNQTPDLILLDYSLPDINGKELIEKLNKDKIHLSPFIITTGQGDERIAVDMMKLGAKDYIIKDILFLEKLPDIVKRVIKEIKNEEKLKHTEEALKKQNHEYEDLNKKLTLTNIALFTAKNKAEENQKLYEDLVQSSHNLIWKCDLEGKFTFLNSAWENTHGYKVEEMLGKPFSDFQRPEVFERDVIEFTKHLKGGFVKDYETTHIIKDGTEIPLLFNALPLSNSLGQIIGTQGTAFDISKLKQIEIELIKAKENAEESEDRLRGFMDSATDGFMLFDSELNQININDVALRITKQKKEEIIGRNMLEVVPDLKKSGRYDKFMEVISTGNPITFDDIVPHAKFGDIRISLKAFKVAQGLGIILTDITERKRAEDLLKVSEERFRKLYIDTPAIMHSMDKDGRIQNVSKRWLEKLGYELHEVLGHKSTEFLTDKSRKFAVEQYLPKFLKEGFIDNVPYQYLTKGGDVLDILLSAISEKDKNGNIKLSLAVLEDITERKLAEEALKESEERFKLAMDATKDGLYDWDLVTNKIYFSPGWKRMVGYEDNELENDLSVWEKLTKPEDAERSWKIQQENINKQRDRFEIEFKMKHKKGHWVDVHSRAEILYNNGGKAIRMIGTHIDITERKQSEEKIRVAEENLKNTFDLSPSIISKGDAKTGFFIEVNQAVTRILGYSVEEFTSKHIDNFIHPDDRQKTKDEIFKQLKGNEINPLENRYLCKDGTYKWMSWHSTKANEDGIVTTIGSDISQQKIIEQEIIKTKQFYEDISEGVQDGILVTDKNDTIYYANSAMEKIAGVPRDQIQGKNILTDFEKDTTGEFNIFYKQAKKEKKPIWYEVQVNTPAHRDTWQNGWLIPQYKDKNFAGIICTIRDITVRRKAELDLLKLSTAVQQNPAIIFITDIKGIIEYVNPKFTELTGFTNSDVIGKHSSIMKSGKQDSIFYEELWGTVKSGKIWKGQFQNKKKNGELFWESASISAILNESGEIINLIKIAEDITQQKITEQKLKTALDKALESDRLKSAFLSNMSHEIRTPMNGILGFINLLNEPNLSKTQIGEYSAIINKSGDRLLNTINDIIDISKIEAGEVVISNSETSINAEIEELYTFFLPEAKKKGLSLFIDPSNTTENLTVNTDAHKLHGILTNLIKNAIKYTDKGEISISYFLKENFIEFNIKDSGIGIPKNRIKSIFNRFEQADIEDSRVFEGSGLGLAISKAYIHMLGGEISVDSIENKGSTFTFTIPYMKKGENEVFNNKTTIDHNRSKINHLNLLIVEDDVVSSYYLETILKDDFRRITIVENGMEAVDYCKKNPEVDLVLMDIKMPVMNGYDATKEIRKFNKDVLIIAQTAYAMHGDKEKSIEAGCNEYIVKPINKVMLVKTINRLIEV